MTCMEPLSTGNDSGWLAAGGSWPKLTLRQPHQWDGPNEERLRVELTLCESQSVGLTCEGRQRPSGVTQPWKLPLPKVRTTTSAQNLKGSHEYRGRSFAGNRVRLHLMMMSHAMPRLRRDVEELLTDGRLAAELEKRCRRDLKETYRAVGSTGASQGFRSFHAARRTIQDHEVVYMIRKSQWGDGRGLVLFIMTPLRFRRSRLSIYLPAGPSMAARGEGFAGGAPAAAAAPGAADRMRALSRSALRRAPPLERPGRPAVLTPSVRS